MLYLTQYVTQWRDHFTLYNQQPFHSLFKNKGTTNNNCIFTFKVIHELSSQLFFLLFLHNNKKY